MKLHLAQSKKCKLIKYSQENQPETIDSSDIIQFGEYTGHLADIHLSQNEYD